MRTSEVEAALSIGRLDRLLRRALRRHPEDDDRALALAERMRAFLEARPLIAQAGPPALAAGACAIDGHTPAVPAPAVAPAEPEPPAEMSADPAPSRTSSPRAQPLGDEVLDGAARDIIRAARIASDDALPIRLPLPGTNRRKVLDALRGLLRQQARTRPTDVAAAAGISGTEVGTILWQMAASTHPLVAVQGRGARSHLSSDRRGPGGLRCDQMTEREIIQLLVEEDCLFLRLPIPTEEEVDRRLEVLAAMPPIVRERDRHSLYVRAARRLCNGGRM